MDLANLLSCCYHWRNISYPLSITFESQLQTMLVSFLTFNQLWSFLYNCLSVPCGGKAAFDEMANAIKLEVPSAKVTGEEDHRSGQYLKCELKVICSSEVIVCLYLCFRSI